MATNSFGLEDNRRWIHPESGDEEMAFIQMPPEIQRAVAAITKYGIDNGLLRGRVGDIPSRVVCYGHDLNDTEDRQPLRLLSAKARVGMTNGIYTLFEVKGYYSKARPSAFPNGGLQARITASSDSDWGSAVDVYCILKAVQRTSGEQLTVNDVELTISRGHGAESISLGFSSHFGLVLQTDKDNGKPNYLIFEGVMEKTKDREIRGWGLDPAKLKRIHCVDDLMRVQSRITAGVLRPGDMKDLCGQVNKLLG